MFTGTSEILADIESLLLFNTGIEAKDQGLRQPSAWNEAGVEVTFPGRRISNEDEYPRKKVHIT